MDSLEVCDARKQRYKRWASEEHDSEKSFTPTAEQAEALKAAHARVTQEERELTHWRIQASRMELRQRDETFTVDKPLLRLAHGLPSSGKGELIRWLKEYSEEVWQWKKIKRRALIAPASAMANNVGGNAVHSFGK